MKYDYEKNEPKEYKPYWWVIERLKFGFILFVIGLVIYGVYKLIELI